MKATMTVAAMVLAVGMTACAREGDLTGEVFIATRGGMNVKLGLVAINAYLPEVMESHILKRRAEAQKELDGLSPVLSLLKADQNEAWLEIEKIKGGRDTFLLSDRERKALEVPDRKFSDLGYQRFNAVGAARDLGEGAFYAKSLPPPVVSAKTNADGQFTLRLRRGQRYALVAQGLRTIGDSKEEYYWLVWVTFGETKHVMLSNDNIWGSGGAESVEKAIDLKPFDVTFLD